jgi:hypothetical protein
VNLTQLLTFREVREPGGETLQCPHFRCATCGEPISDPHAVVVRLPAGNGPWPTGEIVAVHRSGECDLYPDQPWELLEDFLAYLTFNSRVPASELLGLLAAVEDREAEEARDGEAA